MLQSWAVACVTLPVLVATHVFLFRRRRAESPVYVHLLLAALVQGIAWLAAMLFLGLHSAAQCISAACMIGFFCLSYGQAFSLTVRGFSLRVVVDIFERGPLNEDQVITGYSGGRGLDWMYEKRLAALESLHLIRRQGPTLSLARPFGLWAGILGLWTKRLLKMGSGG